MKNVLLILIALFNFSLVSQVTAQVDTGIIFDAVMFEETIKVVVPMAENIAGEKYDIDTIITFDADTYEETIEIVKRKVLTKYLTSINSVFYECLFPLYSL